MEDQNFNYYLIGDQAVDIYNEGYENGTQEIVFGADAVNCADVLGRITYDVFKEEIGVTTINDFKEAITGCYWISISKEEYLKLEK